MKKIKVIDPVTHELIKTQNIDKCKNCGYIFCYSNEMGHCNAFEKNVKLDEIDSECEFKDIIGE